MSYAAGSMQLRQRVKLGDVDVLGISVKIAPQDWKEAKAMEQRLRKDLRATKDELHQAAGRIEGAAKWVAFAFMATAIGEVIAFSSIAKRRR